MDNTNIILYIPNLDKNLSKCDILNIIDNLNIGLPENAYITPGIIYNSATVMIDWKNSSEINNIKSIINSVDKHFYVYSKNGNQYEVFNKSNLSAFGSRINSNYSDKDRIIHDLNVTSGCGNISGGWQSCQSSNK